MAEATVGLLHPGEMGSVVGECARAGGTRVLWVSEGRSAESRGRAEGAGLEDAGTLSVLVGESSVILSVCPPHAALEVARAVAALGFSGVYADANAVSPATTREIGEIVGRSGATFVDGGIVGPPPETGGTTRLYLSGNRAATVASLFKRSPLEAVVLEGPVGAASAVKMAYASYTKGVSALLMAIRTLAISEGVDDALLGEWKRSHPELPARSESAVRGSARKAWRFSGEMEEIARTFAGAGLPDGFHRAAAEIYARLAGYKDAAEPPSVAEVADTLRKRETRSGKR